MVEQNHSAAGALELFPVKCTSIKCAGFRTSGVKKLVPRGTVTCPDCSSILVWGKFRLYASNNMQRRNTMRAI